MLQCRTIFFFNLQIILLRQIEYFYYLSENCEKNIVNIHNEILDYKYILCVCTT